MLAKVDQTFSALADPTRRAIVDLLCQKPLRSSELAVTLSVSRPVMSRHLRVLRKAGLVEGEELDNDARVRIYQLRQKPFSELRTWLSEVEAFWSDQLEAFKEHAEKKYGDC